MKRILLASPVRGGVSPTYVRTLMSLLLSRLSKIGGGPNAPFDFQWAATSGTSVAMARDTLADYALKGNYDYLLFWDIDLGHFDPGVTLAMFNRLLSHDVDVVAAQYVGHNFNSQWHGARKEGAEPREDGLMEMMQLPLGFSLIKVSALRTIREKLPWHEYLLKETHDVVGKSNMFEYFPNGVVGPNTAQEKLDRIKELFEKRRDIGGINYEADESLLLAVQAVLHDNDYSQNIMLGEDYYFCKLCRDSGVKLFIDNNLIIPHETSVRLPVNNGKILDALTEPWRLAPDAKPEQVTALLDKLVPLLSSDIP